VTARLLLFAAFCFAVAALSLLAHRRVGYAAACLAGAWFTAFLFAALRIGAFADGAERDAADARWVAGIGCGCGGMCWDCDLRGDDR
jgi:hypothetical protein